MRSVPRGALLAGALLLAACEDRNFTEEQVIASGSSGAPGDAAVLVAAQLTAFLRGSTLVHEAREMRWYAFLRRDGSMAGQARPVGLRSASVTASGTWEITEDGRFCRNWDTPWIAGDTGCAEVRRDGEVYVFEPVGGAGDRMRRTRLAGNPLSL